MKTLSIQQPWASLICSGLKNVENRTWAPKELPVRILIHASSKKVPKHIEAMLPELMVSQAWNARTMGFLPEYEDMPTSAIIGWADVVRIDEEGQNNSSIWADKASKGWILENVHVFDEPILNVKGKLGLFDYPLEENNLPPSHTPEVLRPVIKGKEISIPVGEVKWKEIEQGSDELILYLTPTLFDIIGDASVTDSYAMLPLESIKISCCGKEARYMLTSETGIYYILNEKGEPHTFEDEVGETYEWLSAQFILGEKL